MHLHRLVIHNYRALRHVELTDLPRFAVVVGANGVGKSTLFDALQAMRDILDRGADAAFATRDGYDAVRSRGETGPISFEVGLQPEDGPPLTWQFDLVAHGGRVQISRERLDARLADGRVTLIERDGARGRVAVHDEHGRLHDSTGPLARFTFVADEPDQVLLGKVQLEGFPLITAARRFIADVHLSDLRPGELRRSQGGLDRRLDPEGANLAAVAHRLQAEHPKVFDAILDHMRRAVPGLDRIDVHTTIDRRLLLRFGDGAFADPFLASHTSDGTLALFAHLVQLYSPDRQGLLCVEEPENHLHPALLSELLEVFRSHGNRSGQVLVSTHAPDLLDGAEPSEVFWLSKVNGFSEIHAVRDSALLRDLFAEGDHLGDMWRRGLFDIAARNEAR